MKPSISVIIPVYNREVIVKTALDSLVSQTFKDFEAVIIDDGSTDQTAETIASYNCSNFRYIYQENVGVAAARNKGIAEAKGDFVCFLDSDDYYEPAFLEKMYKELTDRKNDVCYCGYYNVTPLRRIKSKTTFRKGDVFLDYLLGNVDVHTTAYMVRRDFLEKNKLKFTEGVSWGEDVEFFAQVVSKTVKVTCVKEHLTNYTIFEDREKLSAFTMDKIDKEINFINRLLEKEEFSRNLKARKALLNYRLSALITYRLLKAISLGGIEQEVLEYYMKYKKEIHRISLNNKLRSVKLNINKLLLLYRLSKISNQGISLGRGKSE
ncbi:glycosyltransferase family 2 protein [Planococcus lenghuensis]|uniref:Glycosyltransferase 2-like domain-containing protein n=1 Tax=Planococcus lenghuensis TaxID=2213202 RepID=A0A1Q2L1B4_9BACL|nr:glycosyltransferase family A protein [Planococcus lenghuensis]AQQ54221.1 hypothetical protein B0X71_14695 [Planococcus lenghuensis]